jgi:hypothetical protein
MQLVLLRIIQNWEERGQGDVGRRRLIETEEAAETEEAIEELPGEISNEIHWGALEGRAQEALDNRANFLNGQPSWYLYYWDLSDSFQLLDSTARRLSTEVGASDGSVTAVSNAKKRKDRDVDGKGEII